VPIKKVTFDEPTNQILRQGEVVGITDRIYSIEGSSVTFDEVLVRGDLSGELWYNGSTIRVVQIDTMIGLEVGLHGARGPVWKGVQCQVLS
jgi:hypothetical protein